MGKVVLLRDQGGLRDNVPLGTAVLGEASKVVRSSREHVRDAVGVDVGDDLRAGLIIPRQRVGIISTTTTCDVSAWVILLDDVIARSFS